MSRKSLIFNTNIERNNWIYIELVGAVPLPTGRHAASNKKETPNKSWTLNCGYLATIRAFQEITI
jgi:hypothetical protein